jgi:hypothetical protein
MSSGIQDVIVDMAGQNLLVVGDKTYWHNLRRHAGALLSTMAWGGWTDLASEFITVWVAWCCVRRDLRWRVFAVSVQYHRHDKPRGHCGGLASARLSGIYCRPRDECNQDSGSPGSGQAVPAAGRLRRNIDKAGIRGQQIKRDGAGAKEKALGAAAQAFGYPDLELSECHDLNKQRVRCLRLDVEVAAERGRIMEEVSFGMRWKYPVSVEEPPRARAPAISVM